MNSKEFTGPGSVFKIFEWHKRQERDASGKIITVIKPDPNETKKKNTIN